MDCAPLAACVVLHAENPLIPGATLSSIQTSSPAGIDGTGALPKGVTVSVVVNAPDAAVAVTCTDMGVETQVVATLKFAEIAPAAIVTFFGTDAMAAFVLESVIVAPATGAGDPIETVPTAGRAPTIDAWETVSVASMTG
jgi:hypothetical protein